MNNTVIALGFFDGVHIGHKKILKTAADYATQNGLTAAACTFSVHPHSFVSGKTPQMLSTLEQRQALMCECGISQVITIEFDEKTANMQPGDFIKMLKEKYACRAIVCGDDFRFGKGASGKPSDFEEYGITALVCEKVKIGENTVSSTYIRALLKEGKVEDAAVCLGRAYRVSGTVAHGKGLGHKIGYPTFNLNITDEQMLPGRGVYAVNALVCEESYRAVTNVGVRPTVSENGEITVETHIPGFSGELYGKTVSVEFIKKLREERRFLSINELKNQIKSDIFSAISGEKEGKI